MNRSAAEIVREYGPFPGVTRVNGVTYDGQQVWIAVEDKLNAFDPVSGKVLRSIDVPAHAGTAFDGQHLYQIADDRIQKIDPNTGEVLATVPTPAGSGHSGLAWAEGTLWVAHYEERKIYLLESLEMPPGVGVSGLESDGGDQFFCGGGSSGKVRAVRRPKRRTAATSASTTK